MAAIDPSPIQDLIDILAGEVQKISAELSAATATAAQVTTLQGQLAAVQTALDQANADLATSQASVADLQTKFKAQTDALAALLPAA
jgi:septal ring factor EnvC (AmiA/AmiB activator)